MSEGPKSIWKKSWTGPTGFLLWFIVLFAAAFVVFFSIGLVLSLENRMGKLAGFALLCAIGFAVAGVLGIAFIRWLCCWKNFRRFLFGLVSLITFIALVYVEEDWRSWHAWNQYKREQQARGEKFNFKDFVPPSVPEDQNFALTPVVFSCYGQVLTRDGKEVPSQKRDEKLVNRLDMPLVRDGYDSPTNGGGIWEKATLTDLVPWQQYYRELAATTNLFPVSPQPQTPARDVLLALSKYDSTIEDLREASKLPYSRFPIEYDKDNPEMILLPHLAAMKSCVQLLRFRVTAELQNGQSDKALDDVKLMLYLNGSIHDEPVLISHLVRVAMMAITLQPIYEGLAGHQWSEAQLAELDS